MQRFPLIDILRGFAALLVVFYHVLAYREWPGFPHGGLAELPRSGWVGVDLFLVISGFVISHTALNGFAGGGAWRLAFAERRLRRIVPCTWRPWPRTCFWLTPTSCASLNVCGTS
ncbi:MAG: acyltransferase [Betaproteobacteria bacterium]|nr:acyltransferase [Betaproteobacteria bacterium]